MKVKFSMVKWFFLGGGQAADGSDSDVNQAVTPEVSVLGGSPKKLNATEEAVKMAKRQRKEEDGGAKLQNMLTQRLRNTVWSNRNNQRARTGGKYGMEGCRRGVFNGAQYGQ